MFTDQVELEVRAGKGGNGVIAWRREKYIPKGGPCGGDGGKGGSIIVEVDSQVPSLEAFRYRKIVKAENGIQGGSNDCRGRNGKNFILKVPCGTLIKEAKSGKVLFDLTQHGEKIVLCKGGIGGKGNTHFKTPTNRAPNMATPGKFGEILQVEFELKLIADVGLVGFPNAGKSTLMSKITHVPVKIAPYPFTTLRPNLGYWVGEEGKRILFADIPGIIENAHQNKGLGFEFLRHIERTHALIYVVDISGFEERDPLEDFAILRKEIGLYNKALLKKPCLVILNKIDIESSEKNRKRFLKKYPKFQTFCVSALNECGLDTLMSRLKSFSFENNIS